MKDTFTGFLLVDKPQNITTFDIIRHIKKIIKQKIKIAHMGALDPLATGLVILAFGRKYTAQAQTFLTYDKQYIAQAKLGIQTDTGDITGEVIKTCEKHPLTAQDLSNVAASFVGEYLQTPPIYSALKYKGKPLYHYARNKLLSQEELETAVKQKQRIVQIKQLSITAYEPSYFSIFSHVSHGTYIRVLLEAIASRASSCATATMIRRVAIGEYSVKEAILLDALQTPEDIRGRLLE